MFGSSADPCDQRGHFCRFDEPIAFGRSSLDRPPDRIHVVRMDQSNPHAMRLDLECRRLEQAAETPFARRLGRRAGLPDPPTEGTDSNYRAATLSNEGGEGVLEGEKGDLEIKFEQ